MHESRSRRALLVFESSLELSQERRPAYVDEVCVGDPALAEEVAGLLEAHNRASFFLRGTEDETNEARVGQVFVTEPTPGMRLGDFRLDALIGSGGMGRVFRAHQVSLGRDVALKIMPPHLHFSPMAAARFEREVQAAARLHHTHLVGVFAAGQDRGLSFYAMELVDGPTLHQVLEALRRNPVPGLHSASDWRCGREGESASPEHFRAGSPGVKPHDSAGLDALLAGLARNYFEMVASQIAGVADGLHYAHEQSVLHRDVKPSNLLFSRDGRLHLGDFGLARLIDEPGLTQTGDCVGTPYYMAPEQVVTGAGTVDRRTDVYALGATLYELLTLQPPIPGNDRRQVLAQIGRCTPRVPRRLNPRVPRDLETICLKALASDPAERYLTAGDFADDLRRYAQRHVISARRASLLTRGVKLVRRHPALSSASLAVMVLAVTVGYLGHRATHHAHQRAEAEQGLADARLEVLRVQQTEQERLFQAALLAAMQGDQPAVAQAIAEAEARGGSPIRIGLIRGQLDLVSGNFEPAIASFQRVIDQDTGNVAAHALLAEVYARCGLWALSRDYRARALALSPTSVEELILLGRMESYHDATTAEHILDRAVTSDRQNVVARLIRGAIRSGLAYATCTPEHAELALDDLRLAATLLPETPFMLSNRLRAHLIAAAAYDDEGLVDRRDQHRDQAGILANKLAAYPGDYEAHRWRAHFFDTAGDLDQAIVEWDAIKDRTIGYLAMALFRAGRFEEARQACLDYRKHVTTSTPDFCLSLVASATARSRQDYLDSLNFERMPGMDRHSAQRQLHILWCLAGEPQRAQEEIKRLSVDGKPVSVQGPKAAFLSGSIGEDQLLEATAASRLDRAQAHLLIGVKALGEGKRLDAQAHLGKAVALRQDFNYVTSLSRGFLAQLVRNPEWPPWIPDGDASVAAQRLVSD